MPASTTILGSRSPHGMRYAISWPTGTRIDHDGRLDLSESLACWSMSPTLTG
jgi:hypothetical protein